MIQEDILECTKKENGNDRAQKQENTKIWGQIEEMKAITEIKCSERKKNRGEQQKTKRDSLKKVSSVKGLIKIKRNEG